MCIRDRWRQEPVWDRDTGRPIRPSRTPVDLHFGREVRDVEVWRPSVSPGPVRSLQRASDLRIDAGADVTLVSLR